MRGRRGEGASGVPRRMAITAAWQGIGAGLDVFSGSDGTPLTRTIKRIIDPLVLRVRAHPEFSQPVLEADVAARLGEQIAAQGDRLRAAAAWFSVLKSQRRAMRITDGNAQELYFPLSYALAIEYAAPSANSRQVAHNELSEIHGAHNEDAVTALEFLSKDPDALGALRARVNRDWPTTAESCDTDGFLLRLQLVFADAHDHRARTRQQQAWRTLATDRAPSALGLTLRGAAPWPGRDLALCALPQQPPPISADDAARRRPLDKSILERVRSTLRRSRDRTELPDVSTLCIQEAERACAPWGLCDASAQAVLVAGIEIAVQLAPLTDDAEPAADLPRRIQARLRKEAYVMHARRYLADDEPLHPRQASVVGELKEFATPYTARLWARLHGRDVRQEPHADVGQVRTLLDGIARSVSLDHRQQIKLMLGAGR
ncbi:hypothetical protein [Cumulibacter soli]|uniref:hypothetical protein n=1 Tax=Cumulibacter soli TaxID=2546344 RepID=UPI0010673C9F|nr:hypothetical protein [Cumulibacter soli]